MIYLSTGGFKERSGYDTLKTFIKNKISFVELSAGRYSKDQVKKIEKIKNIKKLMHNYYPPPKEPFVINIASSNEKILDKSMKHVKKSIDISNSIGAKDYSFHPGFVTDISPKEIGIITKTTNFNDRNVCIQRVLKNLFTLSRYAKKKGVRLLVENNVMKKSSYDFLGKDTTIMSRPEEINFIMERVPKNIKLLMDVAHLKVSSNVLGFNKVAAFKSVKKWIRAYHLSDNDGMNDSNDLFNEKSWFVNLLSKKNIRYASVEVYNSDINKLKNQIKIAKNFFC